MESLSLPERRDFCSKEMSKYSGLGLDKSQPKLLGLFYYFNIFLGKKNATHLQDGGGFESLLKTVSQQKTL